MQHVAEFAAEALAAVDHVAVDDHAAAEAGADDGRKRGFAAIAAEEGEVPPEGAGIAVVEVRDGLAEAIRQVRADIVAGPIGMHEVGGAARAEHAGAAGRTGRVEADGDDVGECNARLAGGDRRGRLRSVAGRHPAPASRGPDARTGPR